MVMGPPAHRNRGTPAAGRREEPEVTQRRPVSPRERERRKRRRTVLTDHDTEDERQEERTKRRGRHQEQDSSTDGYDADTSSDSRTPSRRRKQITPDKYDGKTIEWAEYLTHFNIIAQVNGWKTKDKAMYLAGSLTGQARRVVTTMAPGQYLNWAILVDKLAKAFDPPHQEEAHRARLRSRLRRKDETPQEFGYSLSALARRAYPA